jgi:hypothetical protein
VPGFTYDIEFTAFTSGTGGQFSAFVLGSTDGGGTWPIPLLAGPVQGLRNPVDGGPYLFRATDETIPPGTTVNMVKVQWQRLVNADGTLTYAPFDCALVIDQWATI